MTSDSEPLLVDRRSGVLTIAFNRPSHGNAIPPEIVTRLTALFRSVADDPSIRAVLVRGEGANFSAGGDLRSFERSLGQAPAERQEDFRARLDNTKQLAEAYLALTVPVVAACQGAVAGAGLLFALAADVVLADETTTLLFAHQRVGLPPDGGVSLLLPRIVGQRKAAELILTAARVTADEALRLNLVSRVVGREELQAEGRKQAERFARAPVRAVALAKALLASSEHNDAATQLAAERDAIAEAVGDPDFEEGVRALIEKRQANFPSAAETRDGA